MPKLPDINSLGARPTPQPNQSVQGYQTGAVEKATEGLGQTISQVGGQIADKKYQQDTDYNTAQAKAYMARATVDASTMFDKDQDYPTFEKRYGETMAKAQQQAASMITDPRQKQMFGLESQVDVSRGLATVRRMATQKEADYGRGTLENNLIQNTDTYLKSPNEEDRVALANSTKGVLQSAVQKGWINPDQAVTRFDKFRTEVTQRSYEAKMVTDPEAVVKELAPTPIAESKSVQQGAQVLVQAAQKHGADADVLAKTMMIESHGRTDAVSPTGALGAFQFTGKTARQYGLTDPTNFAASADKAAQLQADNAKTLTSKGVDPTGANLYLAHQQGATGAAALLQNPDQNAVDVIAPFKKNRADAVEQIVKNGGSEDMTAGEFAQKWADTYDKTEAPSHIFENTNSTKDLLPEDVNQSLYRNAAQLAVQNAMAQSPEKVDEILARPEFQGAFNPKEQEAFKKDARTAFAAKEENALTDRVMKQAVSNTDVTKQFVDGTLTAAQLALMESNKQVTPEYANYIRKSMMANVPVRTDAEKNTRFTDLAADLINLGVKNPSNKPATAKGTADDILRFQNKVMEAVSEGYITPSHAQTWLNSVSEPLIGKIKDPPKQGWFQSDASFMKENPLIQGYQMIDTWAAGGTKTDTVATKADVMRKFSAIMQAGEDDHKVILPTDASRQAITAYLHEKYPQLALSGTVPNAVITQDAERKPGLPGPVSAKPDAHVNDLFRIKKSNGVYAKVFTDGTFQEVAPEEAARLKAQGH